MLLDIQKAYKSLDRDQCLNILSGYGVGPWTLRLLRTYWARMWMVVKSGGYFDLPFQEYRGLTQGNHLSPMVSNVVVEAVIRL